jgi:TPR repeat protein
VKGAQLFQTACTSAVAQACYDLAVFSMSGPAASQDPVKAARLFQQACDGGDPRGCARVKKPR